MTTATERGYKTLEALEGQLVRVYWNSHNKCFSVQGKTSRGDWLVIGHTQEINLRSVVLKVSELGRLRALREGQKNVHAFLVGQYTNLKDIYHDEGERIGYKLMEGAYFQILDTGKPIYVARYLNARVTVDNRSIVRVIQ